MLCVIAWLFIFPKGVLAFPSYLIISEIMYDPAGVDTKHEWLEIFNSGSSPINLEGWKFFETGTNHGLILYQGGFILGSKEYAVICDDATTFKTDYGGYTGIIIDSAFSLSNSGESLAFKNKTGETILEASYLNTSGASGNGFSLEKDETETWRESYVEGGTPGEKNSQKPAPVIYPEGVYINEILPSADEEYIELFNSTATDVDLSNWKFKDASKTGKYIFSKGAHINPGDYLVVYKTEYKFSLNNSSNESVFLYDPNEKIVSEISYKSAKENISYNFNGNTWRWSRFLTPGKENKFNNLPESKEKKDKNIYVGMYADFSSKASDKDGDKLKFVWDFGDGHKSYLKKTRHKFEKAGKYTVILKISDDSEDKFETFNIEVKKYPESKLKITSVVPNPSGNDSENEYIVVRNQTKKKINLKDWSVATGSKNLYNHPITKKLTIDPGETLKITRKISKFTLNNKKSKIELRYPNGKVADKIKYDKGKKSVEDDEIYEDTENGWQWIDTQTNVKELELQMNPEKSDATSDNGAGADETRTDVENFDELMGGQSVDKSGGKNKEELLNYGTNIQLASLSLNNQPVVLGAETIRLENNLYNFTQPVQIQARKGVAMFLENIFSSINYLMNNLINSFFIKGAKERRNYTM